MFNGQTLLATTERLTEAAGKKTWQSTGESFSVFLQPLGAEDAAFYDGNFSQSFKIYIEGVGLNIEKRDRITVDSTEYEVRSTQEFNFGKKHTKAFIELPQ